LRSSNVLQVACEVRAALLGVPSVWALFAEQEFDLLKGFTASLSEALAGIITKISDFLTSG
jgi:hypothetical protein